MGLALAREQAWADQTSGQCFAKAGPLQLCPNNHPAERHTMVAAARLEKLAQLDLQSHDQRQQSHQTA
jgi:hypothetical protein